MPDTCGMNAEVFWKMVKGFLSILSAALIVTNVNLLI
jgi:hypothetical protein